MNRGLLLWALSSSLALIFVFDFLHLGASAHILVRRQTVNSTNDTTAQEIGDLVRFLGPRNQVDFVAILQRNQGMGKRNFYTAIRPFIESVMVRYATLHPNYVRSAIITFSSNVSIPYDHITSGNNALTKCEIFGGKKPLWNEVVYDNSFSTGAYIGLALQAAINILSKGKQNRPSATQVIMVMTDGDFTQGDDPLPWIHKLQKDMKVLMFAAGLGAWFKTLGVSGLASKVSYYGQLENNWIRSLLTTNLSSVPSDVSPLMSRLSDSANCAFSDSNCSDVSSACYCDVDTGISECRCTSGYSRLQSSSPIQCQACPVDTYRAEWDDDSSCLPCSPGFGTQLFQNGSVNASSGCQCKAGANNCTADPCSAAAGTNPCSDHELCSVDPSTGNATCSCRPGWSSPACSVNRDDCSGQCVNGGVCFDRVDGFQCICPFGYRGHRCEVLEENCIFDICVKNNTVSCESPPNNYKCNCVYGWVGDFCENVDLNPTQSSTISSSSTKSDSSASSSSSLPSSTTTTTTTTTTKTTTVYADTNSSSPISNGIHGKDDSGNTYPVNLIIIIVCVVGGVLLILLLVLVIVIATSRRRNRRREEEKKAGDSAGGERVVRRGSSFQSPTRKFGVRGTGTGNRLSGTISSRFSGLWKKWTVRANDPSEWYKAGAPSVPKRRPGLDDFDDLHMVERDETILRNEEIVVDDRLGGWNSYLQDLEKSGIISGGIIAETVAHECAKTKGWQTDWAELEDLEKAIDSRKTPMDVKVQGRIYQIQTNDGVMATGTSYLQEHSDVSSSSTSSSSSSSGSMVIIGVTKCYLIVAVEDSGANELFSKEIQWVVDHITAEGY